MKVFFKKNMLLVNVLIYAAIWGIGGALDEFTSSKFDVFLQELISGEDVREKYNLVKEIKSTYNVTYNLEPPNFQNMTGGLYKAR